MIARPYDFTARSGEIVVSDFSRQHHKKNKKTVKICPNIETENEQKTLKNISENTSKNGSKMVPKTGQAPNTVPRGPWGHEKATKMASPGLPLAPLWPPLASLWPSLGPLWPLSGLSWSPFGFLRLPLATPWPPFGSLRPPLASLLAAH